FASLGASVTVIHIEPNGAVPFLCQCRSDTKRNNLVCLRPVAFYRPPVETVLFKLAALGVREPGGVNCYNSLRSKSFFHYLVKTCLQFNIAYPGHLLEMVNGLQALFFPALDTFMHQQQIG